MEAFDREFWMFTLVAIFFSIIGLTYILNVSKKEYIAVPWTISNFMLLVMANGAYKFWNNTKIKIFVVLLYILTLAISVMWADSLQTSGSVQNCASVLMIASAILMTLLSPELISYLISLGYIAIWISLTFYKVLS